jgi:hypothetical protein
MDPAELDRYTVFDVEPTVEDWLAWGKDNVTDPIWDFINNNRSHLEHTGDFEPNKVYPSRRSWDRLNSTADAAGLLKPEGNLDNLFTLATAFVGFEAAVALNDYAQNYERVVTVEQLLNGERVEALAAFSLNEHCAMIEKIDAESVCKREFSDGDVNNLAAYFITLPSEAAMKLWGIISEAGFNDNVMKFHSAKVGDTTVGAQMCKILGA